MFYKNIFQQQNNKIPNTFWNYLAKYPFPVSSKAKQINWKLVWPEHCVKMMAIDIWEFKGIGWTFIRSNVTKVIQGQHENILHRQLINTPKIYQWYFDISPNLSSWQTPTSCQTLQAASLSLPPQISWGQDLGRGGGGIEICATNKLFECIK